MKKVITCFLSSLLIASQGNYSFASEDTSNPNLEISIETTSIGQPYIKINATDEGGLGIRKVEINENTPEEVTLRNSTSEKEMETAYFPQKSGVHTVTAYDKANNKTQKTISVTVDDSYTLPSIDVTSKSYDPVTKVGVLKVSSWKEPTGKNLLKVVGPDGREVFPSDPSRPYSIKYEFEASGHKSYDFYVQDVNGYISLDRYPGCTDASNPNLRLSIVNSESNPDETTIRINSWDGDYESGIAKVEVVGGPTFEIKDSNQYSIKTTYQPVRDGKYTFIAYDRKGNFTERSINYSGSPKTFPEIVAINDSFDSVMVTAKSLNGNYLKELELPGNKYIDIEPNSLSKTIIYPVKNIEKLTFSVIDEEGFSSSVSINPINISHIESLVAKAEKTKDPNDISIARDAVNNLFESSVKDGFQDRLNAISSNDSLTLQNATSNVDVYIKSENMLSLSLDTNNVTFEDFSGTEDVEKENIVNLTIDSSLPYQVNAYLATEIQNNDKSKTMDKDILNIKVNGQPDYNTFTDLNTPIVLLDNQTSGNDIIHGIDLMLKGNIAHSKDIYRATVKLEVSQK